MCGRGKCREITRNGNVRGVAVWLRVAIDVDVDVDIKYNNHDARVCVWFVCISIAVFRQELPTRVAFLGEKELGFPFFDTKKVPGTTGAYSHWLSSTSNAPVEKESIHFLTYSTRLQEIFCCEEEILSSI